MPQGLREKERRVLRRGTRYFTPRPRLLEGAPRPEAGDCPRYGRGRQAARGDHGSTDRRRGRRTARKTKLTN